MSLLMLVALIVLYLISLYGESKAKDNWFFRHPKATWGLIVLWMISVLTGEAIFVMRYIA
jgi:FtsH-binding integral membrane protein